MRKFSVLCVAMVILSVAAAVQAYPINPSNIVVTMTPETLNTGTVWGSSVASLTADLMVVSTTDGSKITAADFSNGGVYNYGITGQLAQIWTSLDYGATYPSSPTKTSGAVTSNPSPPDSCLIDDGSQSWGSAAIEDLTTVLGTANNKKWGYGTYLRGASGYQSGVQSTSVNLAYLVFPTGNAPAYDGTISTTAGTYEITNTASPEPASMTLVVIGAVTMLGYVIRRRRA